MTTYFETREIFNIRYAKMSLEKGGIFCGYTLTLILDDQVEEWKRIERTAQECSNNAYVHVPWLLRKEDCHFPNSSIWHWEEGNRKSKKNIKNTH